MQKNRLNDENFFVNKKMKENTTAQAYTFAIRTSRCTTQKLQKSMLLILRSKDFIKIKD